MIASNIPFNVFSSLPLAQCHPFYFIFNLPLHTPVWKFLVYPVGPWLAGFGVFNWGWDPPGSRLDSPVIKAFKSRKKALYIPFYVGFICSSSVSQCPTHVQWWIALSFACWIPAGPDVCALRGKFWWTGPARTPTSQVHLSKRTWQDAPTSLTEC